MVNSINPNRLYSFKGGLKLKHHKSDSLKNGLKRSILPKKVIISLRTNQGNSAKPVVDLGEEVLKGQIIAIPNNKFGSYFHASSSGTVSAIENRITASPDADISSVIEITTDGKDKWIELMDFGTLTLQQLATYSPNKIIDSIHQAGIVGLGGAGFPTHMKYSDQSEIVKPIIETLIINGAECEPYITCDEQLMIDYTDDLIYGSQLFMKASGAKQAVFAIEDQVGGIKSQLEKRIRNIGITNISVIKVPTIYPAGGEKQLIKVLTGLEVPSGGLPLDLGLIVQNVGTIKALNDYMTQSKPLVERIITVAGDSINSAMNLIVPIGTPIQHLLQQVDCQFEKLDRIIIGGPMMGYAMPDINIGIDKTSNCVLALTEENTKYHGQSMPCIRCGECVNVCPAGLLPQQLHWYINGENLEKAREHHLFDCIECGACAWVCPSQIKLVDYYRFAKSELKYLDFKREKSDNAQLRHEQREARLERLKQERINKRKRTRNRTRNKDKMQKDLQATLERVMQAKESKNPNNENSNE